MATWLRELKHELTNGVLTVTYHVGGTSSFDGAQDYLLSETSTTYEGLTRQPYPSLRQIWADTVDDDGLWEAQLQYGAYIVPSLSPSEKDEIGSVIVAFDTGGQMTAHIEQSLTSRYYVKPGDDVIHFGGKIGVSPDGAEVTGADVPTPGLHLTVTKVWRKNDLPDWVLLVNMSAHWNRFPVTITDTETGQSFHFAEGELIFLSATSGRLRSDGGVAITYYFEAYPNLYNYKIEDITIDVKYGHEFVWVYRIPQVSPGGRREMEVRQVCVEGVLQWNDLRLLDL